NLPGQRLRRQRVEGADAVQVLDLVLFRRAIAASLRRDDVHHRRTLEAADLAERPLDGLNVMAVDWTGVFDAEILEERARRDQLFEALLHAPARFDRLVPGRKGPQHAVDAVLGRVIGGIEHRELLRQILRQAANGGRVGPAVGVDDDYLR